MLGRLLQAVARQAVAGPLLGRLLQDARAAGSLVQGHGRIMVRQDITAGHRGAAEYAHRVAALARASALMRVAGFARCGSAHARAYAHAHMHTCTHARMHTYTHAHMHICTHAHAHARAHMHMRMHMHTSWAMPRSRKRKECRLLRMPSTFRVRIRVRGRARARARPRVKVRDGV